MSMASASRGPRVSGLPHFYRRKLPISAFLILQVESALSCLIFRILLRTLAL